MFKNTKFTSKQKAVGQTRPGLFYFLFMFNLNTSNVHNVGNEVVFV